MEDDAVVGDVMFESLLTEAQAEVEVFAAVDEFFVEAAVLQEDGFFDETAGGGDGFPLGVAAKRPEEKMFPETSESSLARKDDAHVIVAAGARVVLHVANGTGVGE